MDVYNHNIVLKAKNVVWIIENCVTYDEMYFIGVDEDQYLTEGYNDNGNYKYEGRLSTSSPDTPEDIFELFEEFAKENLNPEKCKIIMPDCWENKIKIFKNNGFKITIKIDKVIMKDHEYAILRSLINHISAVKNLVARVNALENQISRMDALEKQMERFNDLYNLMNSFSEMTIQNETNKKIETTECQSIS